VYEGARKFEFPAGLLDGEHDSVLLCVPVPLVPYFRRFFAQQQSPYIWKTRADFERAYPAFTAIEAQMTASCISNLVAEQQRLYRLLDTALNGTHYTVVPMGSEPVIVPELPAVPPASANATNSLRAHITRLWQLAENDVAGVTAGPGEGIAGAPALPDDTTARQLLRRLTQAVDGNGTPAPGDNLLAALRGQVESGESRNVIDKIAALDALLDEIKELLQ
jgi:hypothetical protein